MELTLLLGLAALLAWGTALENQQQDISDRIIRLHVVANSDDPADQSVKLLVRDAVLAEAQQIMDGAESRGDALRRLSAGLERLAASAGETLESCQAADRVQVTLARELFGVRYYDGFALPGGYYDTLRVEIGEGAGKNWWCVVYPQICLAATVEERETVAVMGGLDEEQIRILEADTPEYQFKFRSLELLEDILGWFRGGKAGIPDSG